MCIHHISCPYVVYFVVFSLVLLHIFFYIICVYIDNIHITYSTYITIIHCHWTIFLTKKKSFFYFKKCKIPIFDPIFEAIVNFSIIFDAFEYGYGYDLWPISCIDFCFLFVTNFFFYIQRHPIYWKWRIWIFHSINTCLWYGIFLCLFENKI